MSQSQAVQLLLLAVSLCTGSGYIFGKVLIVNNNKKYIQNIRPPSVYKFSTESNISNTLMDQQFPTSLDVYCETFGISFFCLKLKCIFCGKWVSLTELAEFFEKHLSLVWKNNVCHACCLKCLCLSARYETEHYFQCACEVENLSALLNKSLDEIIIRCYFCLALLDLPTKCDLIARKKPACLVRGHWRAPCRQCLNRELWL